MSFVFRLSTFKRVAMVYEIIYIVFTLILIRVSLSFEGMTKKDQWVCAGLCLIWPIYLMLAIIYGFINDPDRKS